MLLSRSAFRVIQPLRMHARRYATESTNTSSSSSSTTSKDAKSSSSTLLWAVGALAAGGLGYAFFSGSSAPSSVDAAKSKVAADVRSAAADANILSSRRAFTGGDQGFVPLVLDTVEIVNHNTKKLTFKLPEPDMVSGLHIASALLTRYKAPSMDKPFIRPYTPISDEDTKGYLTLLIKNYPTGNMSAHLHEMQPGHQLEFKGPLPKYPWTPNQHTHIGLLAGGTGITPMYQLCRRILNNPEDRTKVTLIFGNIAEEDILLRRELDQLENRYPQRFRVFYALDKPASSWPGHKGHITKELLKTVLPEPKEEGVKVFVCGPPGMMKTISGEKKSPKDQGDLEGMLKDLGYTKDQVYKF